MDLTIAGLLSMARDTVSAPRDGARRVLALGLPVHVAWNALALMAVGSALPTHLSYLLSPPPTQAFFAQAMSSPFRTLLLQG
ncbi:MAG TPA: YIP1 family protein, partial [Paracoccaceae bacterium]|nr:YIP1 family protein [Paracoccaceae bacterium]